MKSYFCSECHSKDRMQLHLVQKLVLQRDSFQWENTVLSKMRRFQGGEKGFSRKPAGHK